MLALLSHGGFIEDYVKAKQVGKMRIECSVNTTNFQRCVNQKVNEY